MRHDSMAAMYVKNLELGECQKMDGSTLINVKICKKKLHIQIFGPQILHPKISTAQSKITLAVCKFCISTKTMCRENA